MNVDKIILTRCQIFHLKCTKFNSHSAPQTRWIWEGREKGRGDEGEGKMRGEKGMNGRGEEGGEDDSWSLEGSTPLQEIRQEG